MIDLKYIQLTEEENAKILDMAQRMVKFKEDKLNLKQGAKDDVYYNRMGFSGELAVHKYFNVPYKYQFQKSRTLVDIMLKYEGVPKICDIKTNDVAWLRVPEWHIDNPDKWLKKGEKPPQIYIFVEMQDPDFYEFAIHGIISKKRFERIAHKQKFRSFMYCLDKGLQDYELQSIDLLTA